uniref:Uncharacterized protein n=1 Tax=Panagrolaimus superbus TaxID=310955 RepID=A0A914Z4W0_9BILA
MQLPSASNHLHSESMSTVPAHYSSYFSSTPHSRPIQINAPSTAARFAPYNTERVMGLDFDEPATNELSTNIDSIYLMDFMDDENPSASSIPIAPMHQTDSIENALRRAALSTVTEDNKENGTKTATSPPSASSPKMEGTSSTSLQARELSNIQIFGEPGSQNFKRRNSFDDDNLINEETESEAGFSGEDDCMSNCGCVHSCIGSPIDFAPSKAILDCYNNTQQPFTRLGFRSVGDIIGYAKVVKAERLEALAELRNAVEKFNDMRQRKNNNQNLSVTKFNPTN